MNKSFLVAIALGSMLSACSSNPSDLRPSNKVSLDQVPPGSRDTDIYNLDGSNPDATPVSHGAHGAAGDGHQENKDHGQKEVMLNHEEGSNDIGKEKVEQVAPEDKTNDASKVENHE